MKKIILFFLLSFHFAVGQSLNPLVQTELYQDTLHSVKWYKSNAFRTVCMPALLIGYGITTIGNHGFPFSSQEVQRWRQRNFPTFTTDADNYLPSSPLVIMFGLDLAGVKSNYNWVNQAIIFWMSNALNGFATRQLKHATAIERPDEADHLSFPSDHTSSAFVAAEMLHQEFRDKSAWISIGGYTIASSVAALRIMNNRHWLSDVIAGAGVGILSVRLTYQAYPLIRKKVFKKIME